MSDDLNSVALRRGSRREGLSLASSEFVVRATRRDGTARALSNAPPGCPASPIATHRVGHVQMLAPVGHGVAGQLGPVSRNAHVGTEVALMAVGHRETQERLGRVWAS